MVLTDREEQRLTRLEKVVDALVFELKWIKRLIAIYVAIESTGIAPGLSDAIRAVLVSGVS